MAEHRHDAFLREMHMSVPELLVRPFLALFPHGGQRRARRNAYVAVCVAEAHQRDRAAAAFALAAVSTPAPFRELTTCLARH